MRGGVEVGVGEDDVGRLAAELEGHRGQGLGRAAHDLAGGDGPAGEADLVDAGVGAPAPRRRRRRRPRR